jgi:hypothetical protein
LGDGHHDERPWRSYRLGFRRDREKRSRETMNEVIYFGARAVDAGHGIRYRGRNIGVGDVGLSGIGDLLAYRQMWEPFIAAHLEQWRNVNDLLESVSEAKKCPSGIFEASQIQNLPPATQSFCASLVLSRMYTSDTHPFGILPQWNAWAGKSSAEILAGARSMLEWHQDVVMRVGGIDKDNLVRIADAWKISVKVPDLPSFTLQQDVIARIEGAYVTAKGLLQIIGYGAGETLKMAGNVAQAVEEGLVDSAKQLPKTTRWIGVAAAVTAVAVGGALLIYYVPKRRPAPPPRMRPAYYGS